MGPIDSALLRVEIEPFLVSRNFGRQRARDLMELLAKSGIPEECRPHFLALVIASRDQVTRAREEGLREGLETLVKLSGVQGVVPLVQFQTLLYQSPVSNVSSKYHIEGGQQGAVGDNAEVHDNVFNQQAAWAETKDSVDLPTVATQLGMLLVEMRKEVRDPEHFESATAVAKAEKAAIAGDGPGVMGALASAGKWALDFSSKVGASLVTELLKKIMFPGQPGT